MFVPIRRDPIVFRAAFSDASALQKNVNIESEKQFLTCVVTSIVILIARTTRNLFSGSLRSTSLCRRISFYFFSYTNLITCCFFSLDSTVVVIAIVLSPRT